MAPPSKSPLQKSPLQESHVIAGGGANWYGSFGDSLPVMARGATAVTGYEGAFGKRFRLCAFAGTSNCVLAIRRRWSYHGLPTLFFAGFVMIGHVLLFATLLGAGATPPNPSLVAPPGGATSMTARSSSRLGIGAEALAVDGIPPTTGIAVRYDGHFFQADAVIGFSYVDNVATNIALGGRFFLPVHRGERADLSVGCGVLLLTVDPKNGDSTIGLAIDAGVRARLFLSANMAVFLGTGLSVQAIEDSSRMGIGGHLLGSAGFAYFFL